MMFWISSGNRVAVGALRVGNTVAAVITNKRVLETVEANIAVIAGVVAALLAVLAFVFPCGIAYLIGVLGGWIGLALLYCGVLLYRRGACVRIGVLALEPKAPSQSAASDGGLARDESHSAVSDRHK